MKYESKFERLDEAFPKASILKAIQLTNKIVGRRIGAKIYSSYLPIDFINSEGRFSGLYCLLSNGRVIRYNYKIANSAEIVSIDFWLKKKKGLVKPDYTIDTTGINIVKLIDIISNVLQGNIEPEYQIITESIKGKLKIDEDFTPKTKGAKSTGIANALKQWAITMDVDDKKLETTKISYLYKDFFYWFNELADETIEPVTEQSFRNYILNFLKDRGLQNIYVRSLKLRSGNKEKIIITDKSSEAAYQNIEHLRMNVSDLRNFVGDSLRAVARGYQQSLVVCGKAGIGKTTITNKVLNEEGMKVFNMNGSIRNLKILYNIFYKHNTPKDVIVFDDVPDMFSKNFIGILNAALDDKPKRILSFPSEIGKDMVDFKKFQPELEFKGKVVILTNLGKNKIPNAMKSRSIVIEVQATNTEMADDIRRNLENVLPEVDMNIKIEVLDFIEQLGKNISSIDYRQYKLCCVFRLTNSPDWKKRVFALLK